MKRVLQTMWAIDLWSAAALALATGLILGFSDRTLESTTWVAGYAVSAGFVLAGVNIASLRWMSDRAKGSAYGEIIRYVDPGESGASLPYWIITVACFAFAGIGILGFPLEGEVPRSWTVAYFTCLTFLAAYSFFGTISLLRLTRWHHRQAALLQAAEEESDRHRRESQGNGTRGDGDSSAPAT